MGRRHAVLTLMLLILAGLPLRQLLYAQSGLSGLPGYERYKRVEELVRELGTQGRVRDVAWHEDGKSMSFARGGQRCVFRFETMSLEEIAGASSSAKESAPSGSSQQPTQDQPGRALQATWVTSPDGNWIARYRDFNVVLESVPEKGNKSEVTNRDQPRPAVTPSVQVETAQERKPVPDVIPVTTSGTRHFRYGTCCWVYGEELFQATAMWWSPDSRKLAFFEIDERHLRDYFLTVDNTELYTQLSIERYPKAGTDNPVVGLLVYDLESRQTVRLNVGGDRTQYVYNIRFSPSGRELLFSRTNRRQNILEVMAADPASGTSRVVVLEQQATWQENRPEMRFLQDGERFIWETERTGWKHYELRHLDGRLLNALSAAEPYPCESIVCVDEERSLLYYTALSGGNPYNEHLHCVRLDGTGHRTLTSKPLHHGAFHISPDGKWFVATYEAVNVPPQTGLFHMQGGQVAVLASADMHEAAQAGLSYGEPFSFRADDGQTDLHGIIHRPTDFEPEKKYPLLISVYGGPTSRGITNQFAPANAYCEFGFLIATIANRGTTGRGKAFEAATYLKLGGPDLQDQVDGVRYLCQRPYVAATRVGIYGHSYGGYLSSLALLKFPDVFHVGVAGAPVTDWKNYDTIYTERYMRTPGENADGYRDGSCLTYARQLKGKLLLMHGLVDDNVHPANTWQLIELLQREQRRFDLLIYPRSKHALGTDSQAVRWEYLQRHLVGSRGSD